MDWCHSFTVRVSPPDYPSIYIEFSKPGLIVHERSGVLEINSVSIPVRIVEEGPHSPFICALNCGVYSNDMLQALVRRMLTDDEAEVVMKPTTRPDEDGSRSYVINSYSFMDWLRKQKENE